MELSQLGLTDEQLHGLLAQYTPTFYLHPKERYFPCSVDWFLQRCHVRRYDEAQHKLVGPVLVPEGQVTQDKLTELQQQAKPGETQLTLWLNKPHWEGQPAAELQDVPIYAHVKVVQERRSQQPEALEINYCTLYGYNGSYNLFGMPFIKVGEHVGDIEHLTVRLSLQPCTVGQDKPGMKAVGPYNIWFAGIWYNSHRSREGEWCDASAVPIDAASGRVAAYLALNGHGMYPKEGTVRRVFSAANDCCSGKGLVWRPRRVVCITPLGNMGAGVLPVAPSRGISIREPCGPERNPPAAPCLMQQPALPGSGTVVPATQPPQQVSLVASSSVRKINLPPFRKNGVSPVEGAKAPPVVAVVERDSRPWVNYTGFFGTADTFRQQGWWWRAETPVSRTPMQRWCKPWMDELDSLPLM